METQFYLYNDLDAMLYILFIIITLIIENNFQAFNTGTVTIAAAVYDVI